MISIVIAVLIYVALSFYVRRGRELHLERKGHIENKATAAPIVNDDHLVII